MKHEIKNLKKEMQVQSNLIKLKKGKICEKTQTIDQNEKENINYNKGNYWKRKNNTKLIKSKKKLNDCSTERTIRTYTKPP